VGKFIISFVLLALALPAAAAQVVAEGRWSTADYDVAGIWRIVHEGGRLHVKLGDDFETKNGPDLHLLLSPKPFAALTNANAGHDALVVGLLETRDTSLFLKKMKGAQALQLPEGVDLSAYRSILIHCVKFSHLWAGADLPR